MYLAMKFFSCVIVLSLVSGNRTVVFDVEGEKVTVWNLFVDEDVTLPCEWIQADDVILKIKKLEEKIIWTYRNQLSEQNSPPPAFHIIAEHETTDFQVDNETYDIIMEGGNADGEKCHFPFFTLSDENVPEYHFSCIKTGREDGRCWCSATKNFTDSLKWGFCPCARSLPGVVLLAETYESVGELCHFPFSFKGRVYDSCTTEHQVKSQCWCGIVSDVNNYHLAAICPCPGPPLHGRWETWGRWTVCECGEVSYRTRDCVPTDMTSVSELFSAGKKPFCPGRAYNFRHCPCNEMMVGFENEIRHLGSLMKRTKSNTAQGQVKDATIKIKHVTKKDIGIMECQISKSHWPDWKLAGRNPRKVISFHILNVIKRETMKKIFIDKSESPRVSDKYLSNWVTWFWTEWGPCNRCGLWRGEKRKFGFCYTKDKDNRLLPCQSPLLSKNQYEDLHKLPNFLLYKGCHESCNYKSTLIKAEPGKHPDPPPSAQRSIVKVVQGGDVILDCSKNRSKFAAWQYDHDSGKLTLPITYQDPQTNVYIDGFGRLRLLNVTNSMEGYYSCFIDRFVKRSYHLFVIEPLGHVEEIVNTVPYFVIVIFIFIFGSVLFKVVTTKLIK